MTRITVRADLVEIKIPRGAEKKKDEKRKKIPRGKGTIRRIRIRIRRRRRKRKRRGGEKKKNTINQRS